MTRRIRKKAPHGATHFCRKTGHYWKEECKGYALKWDSSKWVFSGYMPGGMIDLRGSGKTVWAVVGMVVGAFVVWVIL